MSIPPKVLELITRFRDGEASFKSSNYHESDLRSEFLDPFFKALGWDIDNEQSAPEGLKEVVREARLTVHDSLRAPDYSFWLGGTRRFFVEAKKPAVNLQNDSSPAFQVRRYGWSGKLPTSIVTDFEEFVIYDCRTEPLKTDSATNSRLLYIRYTEYEDRWDEIANLFSKEAVLAGKLDSYIGKLKVQKGTSTVDTVFLAEISTWRQKLADDMARRNPTLSQRDLNYAVQMTIDRIVFLRISEDRGIEPYEQLSSLQTSSEIYKALGGLFQLADQRYNSGLFHFKEEKGRFDAPETFTLDLTIGNDPLRYILKRLYYPDSPYAFRVIPVEILGQVYEQFLGQVIRLDTSRQVLIEAKPEVRKAGGVYYTPTYIVNYIVQHTVRTLVEGKTPKQVSDFRILDPACGSGSFLLGAYSFLLEWHLHWYLANGSAKHKNKEIMQVDTETWRLTTKERKRILLNNIYGVDIDTQAVEVTKLSLLLKVLEGETEQGAAYQIGFDRLLPDLGTNIKCGNSLIGPDFYNNNQASFLDEEERYRINVFDWQIEFSQIMRVGGFDAVIGNPPYIFSRNQGISTLDKNYFYSHYSYQSDQLNTFSIFVERCYGILHSFGVLGFITPNNWLTISSFSPLREFILKTTDDITVINILDKVFASANVDTAIILFRKGLSRPSKLNIGEMKDVGKVTLQSVLLSDIKEPNYIIQISLLKNTKDRKVLNKITSSSKPLSDFSTVSTGLKAYQVGKGKPTQTDKEKKDRIFHSTNRVNNTYERYLDGVDVRRYCLVWSGQYLSYGNWLAEPRRSVPFTNERILVRQIPSKPPYLVNAVFTKEKFYNDINSMVIFDPSEDISLKYLLGIINSKLLSMWFLRTFDKLQRKVFPQFKVGELSSFPIRIINFNDNEDLYYYNQIITRIDTMLYLNEFILSAKTPMDKRFIARQIETTDKQIDQLVYDLYGLTAEERDLVEAATQ